MKHATLCYVIKNGKVLLIEKKRGIGKGKLNGPGGKVEEGETAKETAKREIKEEIGIELNDIEKIGELKFIFGEEPFMYTHIFKTNDYNGKLKETKEAKPIWMDKDKIPYHIYVAR